MKGIIPILIVLAGAPVLAGAFSAYPRISSNTSQSTLAPVKTDPAPSLKPDSVPHADSLDISSLFSIFASETKDSVKASKTVAFPDGYVYSPSDAGNILDILISAGDKSKVGKKTKRKETSSGEVLNYMTKVYTDHGFYQSGHWDDAEDWTAITRNVILPDYDPEDFYRPVRGRVTSSYGFRPSFGRLHKGIDLALHVGDTVCAALPGVVAKVAYDPGGYGHYVVLVHNNGMETRYAHLQLPLATLGAMLMAGDPLGLGGNTGNSTGPHLHFEVRYRGTALDPSSLFVF